MREETTGLSSDELRTRGATKFIAVGVDHGRGKAKLKEFEKAMISLMSGVVQGTHGGSQLAEAEGSETKSEADLCGVRQLAEVGKETCGPTVEECMMCACLTGNPIPALRRIGCEDQAAHREGSGVA